jgi:hypothetical protein
LAYGPRISPQTKYAIERMTAGYQHIAEGHVSVDKEAMKEAEVEKTTHKSPHSGKRAMSGNAAKLLQ